MKETLGEWLLTLMELVIDPLRYLNLALSGFCFALTVLVVIQASHSRQKPGGPPVILFWHIVTIAIGTQGMVTTGALWSLLHLGNAPTYYIWGFFFSTVLITIAMVLIIQVQRQRMRVQTRMETAGIRFDEAKADDDRFQEDKLP